MKNINLVAATVILLCVSALPTQAQSMLSLPGWVKQLTPQFGSSLATQGSEIDHQIANMRADVSEQLSAGAITPARASRLTARLNAVEALKKRFAIGGLSADEYAMLQSQLNNVRVAVTEGGTYY